MIPPESPIVETIHDAQIQQLFDRLTLETLIEGKLWVFTFGRKSHTSTVTSRSVIDAWVKTVKEQLDQLPQGAVWYRLNDFSQTDMNVSPYFVARISEISKYRPDLQGHSVYVLPQNLFTQVMINLSRKLRPKHVKVKLCFKRTEGLQWLENELEGAQKPAPAQTGYKSALR